MLITDIPLEMSKIANIKQNSSNNNNYNNNNNNDNNNTTNTNSNNSFPHQTVFLNQSQNVVGCISNLTRELI